MLDARAALRHEKAMGLFGAIWNLYLGLLTLLGNAVLVIAGLALSTYATYQQMQPLHDATMDVMMFVGGILLIAFSMVRRMVWSFCGLAAVWAGAIWVCMQFFMDMHEKPELTPELIAIVAIPPFFMTLYLEGTRKRSSDLEISLTEKSDDDE
jgi:peptidoglycan/LPS O-acetylase OafA/YrhL